MRSKAGFILILSACGIFLLSFDVFASPRVCCALQQTADVYSCPMHQDYRSKGPGKCPRCEMALKLVAAGQQSRDKEISEPEKKSAPGIPDTSVLDQDGKSFNFYTDLVEGKTVAINFIFTTCTTICPTLTLTFRKVQEALRDRVGKDIHLISISVDPEVDSPEALKAFAARFNAGPGWEFITGRKVDVDRLLKALGNYNGSKLDHSQFVIVFNDSAKHWARTNGIGRPEMLAKLIADVANRPAIKPSK